MRETPLAEVQAAAADAAAPPLDFVAALRRPPGAPPAPDRRDQVRLAVAGLLVPDFDPLRLARVYRENGAAAISVLTDERFFQGSLEHLRQVAARAAAPARCCAKISSSTRTRSTRRARPGRMRCC